MCSTTDGELTNGKVGFLYTYHHVSEPVIRWTSALRYFQKKLKKNRLVRENQPIKKQGSKDKTGADQGSKVFTYTDHQASEPINQSTSALRSKD